MSAIPHQLAILESAQAPSGSRVGIAFALSLGVHLLFFGLIAASMRGERRAIVVPVELVFATAATSTQSLPALAPRAQPPDSLPAAAEPLPGAAATGARAPSPRDERRAIPTPALNALHVERPSFLRGSTPVLPALATLPRPFEPGKSDARADATIELAVHDWLRRHQRYPRAARRAGLEGTAHVRFVIDRAGALRETELVASSGHAVLDRAALDLLQRAAPYPALPRRVSAARIELTLPVEYRLSGDATRG